MQLAIDQPFDLDNTLKCGQGHRWLQSSDGWHTTVIGEDLVRIRQDGGACGPVEFRCAADEARIEPLLRSQFRLDDKIEAIYADLGGRDAKMARLIECYPGLRVMRVDPWECLVFFILSPLKSIDLIQDDMEKIASKFRSRPSLGNGRHPFPSASAIADEGSQGRRKLDDLPLGLSKGPKIYEAARGVHRGSPDLGRLVKEPSNALAELMDLWGVGDKVANCVTLFALNQLDAFPVDTKIERALRSTYDKEAPASTYLPTLRKWAQARFGPYAGYASQFLFIDELLNEPKGHGSRLRD